MVTKREQICSLLDMLHMNYNNWDYLKNKFEIVKTKTLKLRIESSKLRIRILEITLNIKQRCYKIENLKGFFAVMVRNPLSKIKKILRMEKKRYQIYYAEFLIGGSIPSFTKIKKLEQEINDFWKS